MQGLNNFVIDLKVLPHHKGEHVEGYMEGAQVEDRCREEAPH